MNRLFNIQKKCLRIIQKKNYLAPSKSLFSYKVLPLPVVNEYHLLILAFKIKHKMIKNNIALRYIEDIHARSTRLILTGNFYVIPYTTKFGFADFYRRGLISFNELPDEVKKVHSLTLFKKRTRKYLLDQYLANPQN